MVHLLEEPHQQSTALISTAERLPLRERNDIRPPGDMGSHSDSNVPNDNDNGLPPEAKIKVLENQIVRYRKDLETLEFYKKIFPNKKKEIEKLTAEKLTLRANLEGLQDHLNLLTDRHRKELEETQAEVEDLKLKLATAERALQTCHRDNKNVVELETKNAQLESALKRLVEEKSLLEVHEREAAGKVKSHDEYKQAYEKRKLELDRAQHLNTELEQRNAELATEVHKQREDFEKYKDKLESKFESKLAQRQKEDTEELQKELTTLQWEREKMIRESDNVRLELTNLISFKNKYLDTKMKLKNKATENEKMARWIKRYKAAAKAEDTRKAMNKSNDDSFGISMDDNANLGLGLSDEEEAASTPGTSDTPSPFDPSGLDSDFDEDSNDKKAIPASSRPTPRRTPQTASRKRLRTESGSSSNSNSHELTKKSPVLPKASVIDKELEDIEELEEPPPDCSFCKTGEKSKKTNPILVCCSCGISVHRDCLGNSKAQPSKTWKCAPCAFDQAPAHLECVFCPKMGGLYEILESRFEREYDQKQFSYAHLVCGKLVHGPVIYGGMIRNVERVHELRWNQTCTLCGSDDGALVRCQMFQGKNCTSDYHASCASGSDSVAVLIDNTHGMAKLLTYCQSHREDAKALGKNKKAKLVLINRGAKLFLKRK